MMTLSQAATFMNGNLLGDDAVFTSVGTDSRNITKGELFFALKGDNFNGEQYAAEALKQGAVAVVITDKNNTARPAILVENAKLSLGELAKYWRSQFKKPVIAITGSNGKTTTTRLTYHLLKNAGLNVGLGGNIGDSFAKQVLENNFEIYVLEISSFQLDNMYDFKADVAVLLNITPDHLDRYDYNFQNYVNAKFRIVQNMGQADDFIYYQQSPAIAQELPIRSLPMNALPLSLSDELMNGGYLKNGIMHVKSHGVAFEMVADEMPIKGPHNALNAMAAVLVAQAMGVQADKIRDGLLSFQNDPHRLELVGEINGVRFVNDSKATNVDSTYHALNSYNAPIVWIAGGIDKGNDYAPLQEAVRARVKALVCLGKDNHKLVGYFSGIIPQIAETQDVRQAVRLGLALSKPGDVVLLSPACASFDLFKNYIDRGNQFRTATQFLNDTVEQ